MCEQDGSVCSAPQHRYVFSYKMIDFSGEVWANVFSAEVREGEGGMEKLRLREVWANVFSSEMCEGGEGGGGSALSAHIVSCSASVPNADPTVTPL